MIVYPKTLLSAAIAALLGISSTLALADEASDFVDDASAKGIAEIEAGRLAQEQGTSQDIKDFAQKMIDDHTKANEKLANLARQHEIEMADDAMLLDQAKAMILKLRDGESFDEAYANNQVVAHEQTIELFRDYIKDGENAELKQFAEQTLPKLEDHLKSAKQLQAAHGKDGEAMNHESVEDDMSQPKRQSMDGDKDAVTR